MLDQRTADKIGYRIMSFPTHYSRRYLVDYKQLKNFINSLVSEDPKSCHPDCAVCLPWGSSMLIHYKKHLENMPKSEYRKLVEGSWETDTEIEETYTDYQARGGQLSFTLWQTRRIPEVHVDESCPSHLIIGISDGAVVVSKRLEDGKIEILADAHWLDKGGGS